VADPVSGSVPVGMVLNPRTVSYTTFNPRHSAAFERDLKAQFLTAYADLVYDEDPSFNRQESIVLRLAWESIQKFNHLLVKCK